VLVLHPQAQDASCGESMTGHAYSIAGNPDIKARAMHAALSLTGLKAGVSREELG
jgi:hypothetical protein